MPGDDHGRRLRDRPRRRAAACAPAPTTGAAVMATLADGARAPGHRRPDELARATRGSRSPARSGNGVPVDLPQVGGWIAASGNGVRNAAPRRPVYATRVDAGITGLRLNGGGARVLTPNGDGDHDTLRLTWTNHVAFDSLALRVFRLDGSLVGSVSPRRNGRRWRTPTTGTAGSVAASCPPEATSSSSRARRAAATYNAPSASPGQREPGRTVRRGRGVRSADRRPQAPARPVSPNRARHADLGPHLRRPGRRAPGRRHRPNRHGDRLRASRRRPAAARAGRSRSPAAARGTLTLGVRAGAVVDAVGNWGPSSQVMAATTLIDRTAPIAGRPRVAFKSGVALGSASTSGGSPGHALLDGDAIPVARASGATTSGAASTAVAWTDVAVDHAGDLAHAGRHAGPRLPLLRSAPGTGGQRRSLGRRRHHPRASSGRTSATRSTTGGHVEARRPARLLRRDRPVLDHRRMRAFAYAFTGRAVAWVTTKRPDAGKAKVYLDGDLREDVDLAIALPRSFRQIAFAAPGRRTGTHTLRLVVVGGPSGHARVDLDAVAVLR